MVYYRESAVFATMMLLSFILPHAAHGADVEAKCQAEFKSEKSRLNSEIATLRKSVPSQLLKPIVPSGKCTLRALKLGITFGTKTDYSNTVQIADAMDCLNIKLYEIDQECACRKAGLTYSSEYEDDVFAEYKKVRALERKLIAKGISNPAIKSYVQNLSVTKDCISQASLSSLQSTYQKLDQLDIGRN